MWGNIPFSYNKHGSVLGRQGKNHPSIAWCSQNTTRKQWSKMKVKRSELCGVHPMGLLTVYWSFLGGHSAPGALWQLLGGLPNWTFVVVFLYLKNFLLEDNFFTMLWWSLPYISHSDIYPLPPEPPSPPLHQKKNYAAEWMGMMAVGLQASLMTPTASKGSL